MKFFLGTTNPHKIAEIGAILSATGCDFETTYPVDPEETEADFDGNARLKARAYAKHAGGITISEDSGLIIPSIGNLPGPYSARFSDCVIRRADWRVVRHNASSRSRDEIDQANNELVLQLMHGIEQPKRAASFAVVLVVAKPDGEILFERRADSYGWISAESRGKNGFGYDPIFVGQDTAGLTYAELDSARKNLRSHRRKVLQDFKVWLGNLLKNG